MYSSRPLEYKISISSFSKFVKLSLQKNHQNDGESGGILHFFE